MHCAHGFILREDKIPHSYDFICNTLNDLKNANNFILVYFHNGVVHNTHIIF